MHTRKVFSQDTITDWRNAGGILAPSGYSYFAIQDDPAGSMSNQLQQILFSLTTSFIKIYFY